MNGRARRTLILCAIALGAATVVGAQIIYQPTPTPIATAENEAWYLSGEPITVLGDVYYPAGPQVHFKANEMVRSGFYRGIAVYTWTMIEPFSAVFVPLRGGMMQPYHRRRAGDIAGTAGSITSPLPIEMAAEDRTGTRAVASVVQAPAPPTNVGPEIIIPEPPRTIMAPGIPTTSERAVGTAGRVTAAPVRLVPAGEQPSGVNAIFIRFRNSRWYASGGPVQFDAAQFQHIGDYHGFPVYIRPGHDDVIYIPTTSDIQGLVVPYSTRRQR